jgi:hypothetical protein
MRSPRCMHGEARKTRRSNCSSALPIAPQQSVCDQGRSSHRFLGRCEDRRKALNVLLHVLLQMRAEVKTADRIVVLRTFIKGYYERVLQRPDVTSDPQAAEPAGTQRLSTHARSMILWRSRTSTTARRALSPTPTDRIRATSTPPDPSRPAKADINPKSGRPRTINTNNDWYCDSPDC